MRRITEILKLLLAVIFCSTSAVLADDSPDGLGWPNIRGPHYDGKSAETGLAESWPKDGPPVLWTRELGQGYSSFVAWDNRVATQYQTLSGQFVVCLDADTGDTVWEYRYDWPYDPAAVYPGPRATPTFADGAVYFASPAGLIGCLDAETGNLRWSVELAATFGCELTGFGYACSPTVIDGMVLLPVGCSKASMVALDANAGKIRWQAGNNAGSYTPAFPIEFEGRPLVLGYLENTLVCHDRMSGELLWLHKLSTGYDEHSSWPLYREPFLWISCPFRTGAELLELSADPEAPVRSLGKQPLMSNDIFSSVLIDGAIYGFDVKDPQAKTQRSTRGIFRCIDFETGSEHWSVGDGRPTRQGTTDSPGSTVSTDMPLIGHATVITADGKLILFNDLGELILARATTEKFDELGRVSVLAGEICWTQPALSRGRLFVRNQSRAACVFLGDPNSLQPELRQRAVTTASIPQSAYVDWASVILGIEPEYAFDLPSMNWLRLWFTVCLPGIMGGCLIIASLAWLIPWYRRTSRTTQETVYWVLVFIAGVVGTTLLSRPMNDFVFTWPVALFASYQGLMDRISLNRQKLTFRDRLRSGLACLIFLACCLAYFLACRRLSLVFEWTFLFGFAAAIPFSIAGRYCFQAKRWQLLWKMLMTVLAFSAFYWSAVAVLYLRVN
ncbi:MAG TPA: PQQ-binding-like beta-propeller repeat protein [Planctomycetaceae bacterium]|nr:PQQ-binding-like beta-propeller repeat protein [Planctomycetaceae bacterium]